MHNLKVLFAFWQAAKMRHPYSSCAFGHLAKKQSLVLKCAFWLFAENQEDFMPMPPYVFCQIAKIQHTYLGCAFGNFDKKHEGFLHFGNLPNKLPTMLFVKWLKS